jgi:hypothetical protein
MNIEQTRGGSSGHYLRRIIHIFTFIIPLIYYNYAVCITQWLEFSERENFSIPIIWSWSFGDPLLGELRRYQLNEIFIWLIGIIFIAAVWLFCYWWLATPWWWALIMGPLAVASEKPTLKWIDDNALMQLIPLIVVSLF